MKRRSLWKIAGGACLLSFPFAGGRRAMGQNTKSTREPMHLAGFSLPELRDQYHTYLFDDFVPFIDKYVIDHDNGGFMYNTDRDGKNITTDKGAWYEGRGIWIYSMIYNELAREQRFLNVAQRSAEFILKNKPSGDGLWPERFSKDGAPLSGPSQTVYGDLYIAAGLAEYAKAAGDRDMWDTAKGILMKCLRVYNRNDYDSITSGTEAVQGPRRQNVVMLILPTTTSLLKYRADSEIESVAADQVDVVVNRFYNPAFRLNNTILNHDYSRPDNAHAQSVSFGASIQTLWMILYEAVRLGNIRLRDTAIERIKRHITVAWDDVYGGIFSGMDHVDNNVWNLGKPLYNHAESLIGLLATIEHTGDREAIDLFSKIYAFTIQHYMQKDRGFALWQDNGDRFVTFREHTTRAENFHHPRHLVLNLMALSRMTGRT